MANIYNIQQELLDIFDEIEANEGEITAELENRLKISQAEFKDKITSYVAVIKQLNLDLKAIKEEKSRLDSLKQSKEKTIERLKSVMVDAINMFGDTTKSGTKFIDYGTGKISIRKSESVELEDDKLKAFTNRFIQWFNVINYQNTFDQTEFDCKEITDYCNQPNGSDYDIDEYKSNFTEDDLAKIQATLDFNVNLKDMIATVEGRALMHAIFNYNSIIKITPAIDKKSIKEEIKSDGVCPSFANLVTKDNLTIK